MLQDFLIFNKKSGQLVYHKKIRSIIASNKDVSAQFLSFFFTSILVISESAGLGILRFFKLDNMNLSLASSAQFIVVVICDPADGESLPQHLADQLLSMLNKGFKSGAFEVPGFESMLERFWVKIVSNTLLSQLIELKYVPQIVSALILPDFRYHGIVGDKIAVPRSDALNDMSPVVQSYVSKLADYGTYKNANVQINANQYLVFVKLNSCCLVYLFDRKKAESNIENSLSIHVDNSSLAPKYKLVDVLKKLEPNQNGINTALELLMNH